jgi:hypothetical protein
MNKFVTELNSNLKYQNKLNAPCNKYCIEIRGVANWITVGSSITKNQYNYWNNRSLEYLITGDCANVPDKMKFFEDGEWYSCNDLWESFGVYLAGAIPDITVSDENGNKVWVLEPNLIDLNSAIIKFELENEFDCSKIANGAYVFEGIEVSEGLYYQAKIVLTDKFDPTKLKFLYDKYNGTNYLHTVLYEDNVIRCERSNTHINQFNWRLYQKK